MENVSAVPRASEDATTNNLAELVLGPKEIPAAPPSDKVPPVIVSVELEVATPELSIFTELAYPVPEIVKTRLLYAVVVTLCESVVGFRYRSVLDNGDELTVPDPFEVQLAALLYVPVEVPPK
jgi:hypothetical protein